MAHPTKPTSSTSTSHTDQPSSLFTRTPEYQLDQAKRRYVGAVQRLALARAQHAEQPSAGRLHTVILFEAGVELAQLYLERAEDLAEGGAL